MDSGKAHDLTRRGSVPGHQEAASSELGFGAVHPVEEDREQHGLIASAVKGAFKIYLVPAMRAQNTLATVSGCWRNLVTEARQEHEARKQTDDLKEPDAELAVAAGAVAAPITEPGQLVRRTSATPTAPGRTGKPRATGACQSQVGVRREGSEAVTETSPSRPGPVKTVASETPPPTLVQTGESSVEVRPNPAISPSHATSGVIGHLPPEVRHKLAGDGPIRA